jgi:hypothetical protein
MKIKFEQTENEIDFNKIQLLQGKNTGNIILSSGKHSDDIFCGTILHNVEKTSSLFSYSFLKDSFKLFKGEITISND